MKQQSSAYFKYMFCVILQKLNLNGYINARLTVQPLAKFRYILLCFEEMRSPRKQLPLPSVSQVDTAHVWLPSRDFVQNTRKRSCPQAKYATSAVFCHLQRWELLHSLSICVTGFIKCGGLSQIVIAVTLTGVPRQEANVSLQPLRHGWSLRGLVIIQDTYKFLRSHVDAKYYQGQLEKHICAFFSFVVVPLYAPRPKMTRLLKICMGYMYITYVAKS